MSPPEAARTGDAGRFRRYTLVLAASLIGFTTVAGYVVGANAGERATITLFWVLPVPATPGVMTVAGAGLGTVIVLALYGLLRVLSTLDQDAVG